MTAPRDPAARSTDGIAGQIRYHAEELGLGLSEEDATVLARRLWATLHAVAAAARSLEAPSGHAVSVRVYSDDE